MEVARSKEDILVTQRKCTLDLLKETDMIGCKPAETLMDPRHRLGAKLEVFQLTKECIKDWLED